MPQDLPLHPIHPDLRPNLEYYRKQAKSLLKAFRNGDESAAQRLAGSRQGSEPRLCDAQHVVARENGFRNWSSLQSTIPALSKLPQGDADAEVPPESPEPEESGDAAPEARRAPGQKQRYERDQNVQRWLRSKARDGETAAGFSSPFLLNHRERDWIMSSLQGFHAKGLIADVVGQLKAGKEATVYRCVRAQDSGHLAAKIYRPRMFRNLQNDAAYRESRMDGRDRRSRKAMDNKSRRGRSFRMDSWIQFEFETQRRLFEAGVRVPRPVDCQGNAILMELIGDADQAAPRLCDVDLDRSDAPVQFGRLMRNIEVMLACDRIHADLSPYNVLYWQGTPVIIDLAQAVDARSGSDVLPFLLRDVDRLARHFVRLGVEADPESLALEMWARYTRGDLSRFSPGEAGSGDLL